jgi:hypothetical protein
MKQHLLNAWKWGITKVENQGLGSQVVRVVLLTKKSDRIIKQLKLQGKKLYKFFFVDIKLVGKEFMSNSKSAQA